MNLDNETSSDEMNEDWQTSLEKLISNFKRFGIEDENTFKPDIDIWEDEKNIHLDIEIPGIAKDDLDIKFEKNVLSVRGEKKKNITDDENVRLYKSERVFGTFSKNFTLPEGVDSSLIEAGLNNGILEIIVPKILNKKANERIIEVR